MTSHSWSTLTGAQASSAPYINQLVVSAAHAEQYFTPPNNHPSEPNFIWLEAGDNLGITDSNSPSANHKATTEHLSTQLEAAGISWRAYAEGISGTSCPLTASGSYNPKHLPQVYFDDVTDGTIGTSAHCISHVRPYTELAADLSADRAARYTFITPDLCNDMSGIAFGSTCASNLIKAGDDWLHTAVPVITASAAFKRGGVLFIVWDEGEPTVGAGADGPIGLIAIGASVKPGFASQVHFTHSSLLRTIEEIFGVTPLRGAATSNDLSALFTSFP